MLISVDESWRNGADICACADEEKDDEKEGLEVEKSRLDVGWC